MTTVAPLPDAVPLPGARPGRDPARAIKRGPSRVPPEVVAATQRDRLYDGLVHTVAQKGYTAARITDICAAAGVTRPAFYALFAGKEDAFLAAYRHGTGVLLHLMEQAYRQETQWRAGARAVLRVLLDVLASVPSFARMAVVEVDAVGPAARRERDLLLRRFDQFFADAPGPAVVPAAAITRSVVGGVYSTIYGYVAGDRVGELPGLLPTLTYFVLVPYLGRAEAGRELTVPDPAEAVAAPCAEPARTRRRRPAGDATRR